MPKQMSEAKIKEIIALTKAGITMRQISKRIGVKYQTVCKYVHLFKVQQSINPDSIPKADSKSAITTAFQLANAEMPTPPVALPPPPDGKPMTVPKDLDEVEERLESMAGKIMVGAERLLQSISNMNAEALELVPLKERAHAFGVLMDRLKAITNKNNPMISTISANPNDAFNIINIIASTVPPRQKGSINNGSDDNTEEAEVVEVKGGKKTASKSKTKPKSSTKSKTKAKPKKAKKK